MMAHRPNIRAAFVDLAAVSSAILADRSTLVVAGQRPEDTVELLGADWLLAMPHQDLVHRGHLEHLIRAFPANPWATNGPVMPRNNRLQPDSTGIETDGKSPLKWLWQAKYRLPERKAPTGIEPV